MTVLVLGGYGAVGSPITARLRADGEVAIAAGRDRRRADRVVDLNEPDARSLKAALVDVDVVVNAAGVEDPSLVKLVATHGIAFIDITATAEYVAGLERLELPAPVLVSVGLAPGLTNILAAQLHAVAPGAIDIAVVLGAGEHHGAAAVAWTYGLLGRRFLDPSTGTSIRNYTMPKLFDLQGYGRRRLYRVDFSDQHVLTRDLGVPVRTYFGLDSRLATAALALLTWLPGGSKAPRGLHLPGGDDWLVLARASSERSLWASGRVEAQATAAVAAIATRVARGLLPGVHHLHQVMTAADLTGVRDIEFGGSRAQALIRESF